MQQTLQRLDRDKPVGKINPPFQREDWDRAAFTEQDGSFFDQYDWEIIPGVPGPARAESETNEGEADRGPSPSELIGQSDTLPYADFRNKARAILGKSCPGGKAQIVEALKRAQAKFEKRNGRASGAQVRSDLPVEKVSSPGGLDLAAWGRGAKNYLFAEVRKAIRARFACNVTTTHDAVDLLIKEKIVTAEQARKG